MADRTVIEVYEWPEGARRNAEEALELINGDATAPIPSVGDVILLPAPLEAVRNGTVDVEEFYIMQGFGKTYRVVGRELMYSPRVLGADAQTPLKFSKVWIFVRGLTKKQYWGTDP